MELFPVTLFFGLIFDSKYSVGNVYTPILVTSAFFVSLSQFFGGILQVSLKRPKANVVTTFTGAIVNLIVHLALIRYIGLYAAVISTVVSNIVIALSRVYLLRNDVRFRLSPTLIPALIMYAYIFAMAYLNKNLIVNIANVLIAGIVFLAMNRDIVREMAAKFLKKSV